MVDIPGHERLRFKFSEFMPIARAVVFVVDSASVPRQTRLLAEYLYDILSNKFTQEERIPVLIACNKTELLTAFRKERIQTALEGELYVSFVVVANGCCYWGWFVFYACDVLCNSCHIMQGLTPSRSLFFTLLRLVTSCVRQEQQHWTPRTRRVTRMCSWDSRARISVSRILRTRSSFWNAQPRIRISMVSRTGLPLFPHKDL